MAERRYLTEEELDALVWRYADPDNDDEDLAALVVEVRESREILAKLAKVILDLEKHYQRRLNR